MTVQTKKIGDPMVFYQGDDVERLITFAMTDENGDAVEGGFMVSATVTFSIFTSLGSEPDLTLSSDSDDGTEIDLDGANDKALLHVHAEDIADLTPGDYLFRLHVALADGYKTTVGLNTLSIVRVT